MAELAAEVLENYLKEIYRLSLDESPVRTSTLAEALALSSAAVSEMLKRLDDQKLVAYQAYRGVSLTRKGRRRALMVIRRHRLWEVFLYRVLNLPWPMVHEHAERLEHATDDRLAEFLDDYLGNPQFDPHGHPIPTADGTIVEVERLRLTSIPPGTVVSIVQCSNEHEQLLDYLKRVGMVPGRSVRVIAQAPFNGPLTLEIEGAECHVGVEAARTVFVTTVAERCEARTSELSRRRGKKS